jgi:copper chaperone CopZ
MLLKGNSSRARTAGKALAITLVLTAALLLASCGGSVASGGAAGDSPGSSPTLRQIALEVPTIWCSACQPRVEASARSVPGVKDVQFDKQVIQRVVITYDPEQTTPDAIVQAIERGGDRVTRVTKP